MFDTIAMLNASMEKLISVAELNAALVDRSVYPGEAYTRYAAAQARFFGVAAYRPAARPAILASAASQTLPAGRLPPAQVRLRLPLPLVVKVQDALLDESPQVVESEGVQRLDLRRFTHPTHRRQLARVRLERMSLVGGIERVSNQRHVAFGEIEQRALGHEA